MKKAFNLFGAALLAAFVLCGPIVATIDVALSQEVVAVATETEAVPVDVGSAEVTEVVGSPSVTPPWWQAIWNDLKGPLATFFAAVVVLILRRYAGEKAAQIAQEMLAAATMRAAGGVINELGASVATSVLTPNNPVVKKKVEEVKEKMAQTIAKTGATDRTIAENIVNQVGELIAAGGQLLSIEKDAKGQPKRI